MTGSGSAIRLDDVGRLQEVLRDEVGLGVLLSGGDPFPMVVAPGSRARAMRFLTGLIEDGAAFDWPMDVMLEGGSQTLSFSGGRVGDGLLVVAVGSTPEIDGYLDELMRIHNEQVASLREHLRRASVSRPMVAPIAPSDEEALDDLSRLNNDLARIQRELARKNADLERLDGEKNRFLGMAAHDLRNPLAVIQGYASALRALTADRLVEQELAMLARLESTAEFMLELVEDLLDLSQIESGLLELDVRPVDPVELVGIHAERARLLGRAKEIAIEVTSTATRSEMQVDPRRMGQVLDNLIGNAIKFSSPGTTVRLRVEDRPAGGVVLVVVDCGPGIPPDELAAIFRPFHRTSVRSTGGEKSTGLGLAIVHRIVEEHGGRISVESEVGTGTIFRVEVPDPA